ncbi:MAG TPA: cell division protein FtsZ [Chthoniobacterales bacterium]|jgi:cell division protein FtsZ|nr:cell division protein FtsZ [Chthoniobacterales bacterium]
MIQLNRNYNLPEKADEDIPIKVVGVGGAGTNVLDRIVLDGLDKADLIAINTDVQSLASSVAATKVQLGRTVTRGLGAGGDPEVGYNAAYESADEIRQALRDARMIFVCTGLGGGTGSGAAPAVAQVARENGSLVLGFATLPFGFEGKRRLAQAHEALAKMREHCDAVICFENDRLGDLVAPKAGIHQAFAAADQMISQSVRSIVSLIQRPGLIRIGFDDLLAALKSPSGRCLFGYGESDSENRAHDALAQALKNPLMDRGRMLADASHVLVQVSGGPGMTLTEVEILMQDLGKHIRDDTQIIFGTTVDSRMGNRLSVTLISSLASEEEEVAPPVPAKPARVPKAVAPPPAPEPEPVIPDEPPVWEQQPEETPVIASETAVIEQAAFTPELIETEEPEAAQPVWPEPIAEIVPEEPVIEEEPPQPRVILPKKKPTIFKEPKPVAEKKPQARQEVMQFEPVTRGRFEKSEPTIVEGQDLDVPTFLRKNVRVK